MCVYILFIFVIMKNLSDKNFQTIGKWFVYELNKEYIKPNFVNDVIQFVSSFNVNIIEEDIKNTNRYNGVGVKVHGYLTNTLNKLKVS